MAATDNRSPYGGQVSDWVFDVAGDGVTPQLVAGSTIIGWTDQTGGSAYSDYLDGDGVTPLTSILSSAGTPAYSIGQIPLFWGPPGVRSGMWISADGGPRVWMKPNDLGQRVLALENSVADNDNRLSALEELSAITPFFMDDGGTGTYDPRPDIAGDRIGLWFGNTSPGVGGTPEAMRNGLDIFTDRTP
jgi:hypothetical protein